LLFNGNEAIMSYFISLYIVAHDGFIEIL